jgi:hypothetical protein
LGISRCYLHRLLNQLNVAAGAEEEAELQEEVGGLALMEADPDEQTPIPRPRVARLAARIA